MLLQQGSELLCMVYSVLGALLFLLLWLLHLYSDSGGAHL
jgi:hypothetical protein